MAQYLYDQSGNQQYELNGAGTVVHQNAFAGSKLWATYSGGHVYYPYTDWLGTKRAEADETGTVQATYSSLPFGDSLTTTGSGPDATEHHFTGQVHDSESQLDYFAARYYNSAYGRWMSPDWSAKADPVPYAKLDDPQSLNLYVYGRNNPLSNIDPDGHYAFTDFWKNLWQRIDNAWNGYGWHTNAQVDTIVTNARKFLKTTGMSPGDIEKLSYKQAYKFGTASFHNGTNKIDVGDLIVTVVVGGRSASPSQSTGRTEAANLNEQLAMEQAQSNPTAGEPINLKGGMKDPRWPESGGWVKMRQNINGTEIHYVRNTNTGEVADFKFK